MSNFKPGYLKRVTNKVFPKGRRVQFFLCVSALLALVQVLLSSFLVVQIGSYAHQRFLFVILSGLLILFCFIAFSARSPTYLSSLLKALLPSVVTISAFLMLSFPFGEQPYSLVEAGMYGSFFLVTFISGVLLASTFCLIGYIHFFVVAMAVTCISYGLTTINVYLFALFDGVTSLSSFIPWGFVNIRYWGHIATWFLPLIPLAAFVGPWRNNRLWHLLVALGAGLWWWIVFLSASRGSALGVAFGVILVSLLLGRRAFPWLKVFLIYLGVGVILWLLLSVAVPSLIADEVQLRTLKSDSSGRWPLWVEAWRMSLQNFPFGMGPQSWLTHEPITEAFVDSKQFGHPHNMYLMWAAEYGWFVIAALGVLVVQAIRNFWRCRAELFEAEDSGQILLLAGFTASVSAALFHAGVSAVFMAPASMLVGMFVLIGFWGLVQPKSSVTGIQPPSTINSGFRVITTALLATVIVIAWAFWAGEVWRYYKDMRADETYYHEHVREGTLPRFWRHGNFPRDVNPE